MPLDEYCTAVPVHDALVSLLPTYRGGARLDAGGAGELLRSPHGHVLAAWQRIERATYGDAAAALRRRFSTAESDRVRGWDGIEEAVLLGGLLGLEVDVVDGQVVARVPTGAHRVQVAVDASVHRLAEAAHLTVSFLGDRLPSTCQFDLRGGLPAGWRASTVHTLAQPGRVSPLTDLASVIHNAAQAGKTQAPACAAPVGLEDAVRAIFTGAAYADGNAAILRGMALLAEDLELRLRSAILHDSAAKATADVRMRDVDGDGEEAAIAVSSDDAGDDDSDGGTVELPVEEVPSAGGGVPADARLDALLNHPSMERAHRLADDRDAATAAAMYAAKKATVSVPIVVQGGGSSCKVGPQHLLLVHQLKLLLRHAVAVYPMQPAV